MSELTLDQSVNLNIFFMILSAVGFISNSKEGKDIMGLTALVLFFLFGVILIIKNINKNIMEE